MSKANEDKKEADESEPESHYGKWISRVLCVGIILVGIAWDNSSVWKWVLVFGGVLLWAAFELSARKTPPRKVALIVVGGVLGFALACFVVLSALLSSFAKSMSEDMSLATEAREKLREGMPASEVYEIVMKTNPLSVSGDDCSHAFPQQREEQPHSVWIDRDKDGNAEEFRGNATDFTSEIGKGSVVCRELEFYWRPFPGAVWFRVYFTAEEQVERVSEWDGHAM